MEDAARQMKKEDQLADYGGEGDIEESKENSQVVPTVSIKTRLDNRIIDLRTPAK